MAFDQTAKLSFVIQAKDLASKTFKEARGNLGALDDGAKKTGKSFKGLTGGITPMNVAFGAAALGATLLVGGLIESTKAAIDEEKNVAKLGASLKANVKGYDGNTTAIERTIGAREKLAFSDDELRDSLAKLVAVTHNTDKAFGVQSVAMDLARFKGISLGDATDALTKVEGGQFRLLKGLGIQLPKNATAQQALTAVMKIAAGQADAYANTIGGKLLAAQIKWQDAQEDFGRNVIPVLTGALEGLNDALDGNANSIDNLASQAAEGSHAAIVQLAALRDQGSYNLKVFEDEIDRAGRSFVVIPEGLRVAAADTVDIAGALPGQIAKALIDHRTAWQKAWDDFKGVVKNTMSVTAQEAKLQAILTGDKLREGLDSKNPEIKYSAQAMARTASDALGQLRSDSGQVGKDAADELKEHLKAGSGRAYNAGKDLGDAAEQGLKDGWGNPKLKFQFESTHGGKSGNQPAATGGYRSGLTWVGEQGPELVNLPSGSYVNTASASKGMGGGSNVTVNINSTFPMNPRDAKRVAEQLTLEMRRLHVLPAA